MLEGWFISGHPQCIRHEYADTLIIIVIPERRAASQAQGAGLKHKHLRLRHPPLRGHLEYQHRECVHQVVMALYPEVHDLLDERFRSLAGKENLPILDQMRDHGEPRPFVSAMHLHSFGRQSLPFHLLHGSRLIRHVLHVQLRHRAVPQGVGDMLGSLHSLREIEPPIDRVWSNVYHFILPRLPEYVRRYHSRVVSGRAL